MISRFTPEQTTKSRDIMTTTATTKIALAALAAPMMTALAIGLAAAAHADADPASIDGAAPSAPTAQDTILDFKDQGFRVTVNTTSDAPLTKCSIISTHQERHQHHGNTNGLVTVYVDAYCPPNA
ncbi:hypothetical protein MMOR_56450 [Mycolicibacterium moriokaense]|uniref:DUF732 domain-containing protein n=2 Tax=Mycolicibacterium moriokaense TaxID=39691 RepID=A0AAD1HGW8_9MYCO|nr:hypothetical protein MMOR_56450 [Mycolicibacterium moriokaense]